MTHINSSVEEDIQRRLTESTQIESEKGVLYLHIYFCRYVEGEQHITGDSAFRPLSRKFSGLPWFLRELIQRRELVLCFDSPACWDGESEPIPEGRMAEVRTQIESALKKKYKRYSVEFHNSKDGAGRDWWDPPEANKKESLS
ncbi:MAG: hypothetical protein JST28_16620 [Acidobacteria bacterium]|nr:hypothetical protein [Acidobacteriota bacterium]